MFNTFLKLGKTVYRNEVLLLMIKTTCHVSHVKSHMSRVTCHMSLFNLSQTKEIVTCNYYIIFTIPYVPCVPCPMSGVTYHLSCVACPMSQNLVIFFTKCLSLVGIGSLINRAYAAYLFVIVIKNSIKKCGYPITFLCVQWPVLGH